MGGEFFTVLSFVLKKKLPNKFNGLFLFLNALEAWSRLWWGFESGIGGGSRSDIGRRQERDWSAAEVGSAAAGACTDVGESGFGRQRERVWSVAGAGFDNGVRSAAAAAAAGAASVAAAGATAVAASAAPSGAALAELGLKNRLICFN